MNSVTQVLLCAGAFLLYLAWRRRRHNQKLEENAAESTMKLKVPKGPISLPFIGNILQLGDRPYETMVKWSKKYGPVYRVRLGSQEVVVLNGTELIRDALINHSEEFAGRPQLYMIHATLKGKGMISSPYNQDFNEHKKFLVNTFNRFGRRRSSLEVNCQHIIRETLNDYRNEIDHNFECVSSQIKNSLSQITSENVFNMTFGIGMHDKKYFKPLADLITENFNNTGVAAAFNFIPVTRIFKKFIMKNVMKCTDYLNVLISEKMLTFNEDIDQANFEIKEATDETNIIECYLKELMNNDKFLSSFPMNNRYSMFLST